MGLRKIDYDNKSNIVSKPRIRKKKKQELDKKYLERYHRKVEMRKRRIATKICLSTIVLFSMAVIILSRFSIIYGLQSNIDTTKVEIGNIVESNEDLTIKISEGLSLEKIEKIALERLGMVYPNRDDVVNLIP